MSVKSETHIGDCLDILADMQPESVDLVYVDPPFFTRRDHKLCSKGGTEEFSFSDIWRDSSCYGKFIHERISLAHKILKPSGSIFFHCDKAASHIVRIILDDIFGPENFQSEIIWYFKRWSNSKRGLLPNHQTIFFYSKFENFKFNRIYANYSPSTNVDQIMQRRSRDHRNKSVYAKNETGEIVGNGLKKGVPLSDVWEIPFLNPKAKERVNYPTQKPVLLMNKIIGLVTDKGDTVLDPFCGSGTTLVAAKSLGRNSIGIDENADAIRLTNERLANPVITESKLLENGKQSYNEHDPDAEKYLHGIDYIPIHRNKGIDGLLKQEISGLPTFVRAQREGETLDQTIAVLRKSSLNKGVCNLIVIATHEDLISADYPSNVFVIPATRLELERLISKQKRPNLIATG